MILQLSILLIGLVIAVIIIVVVVIAYVMKNRSKASENTNSHTKVLLEEKTSGAYVQENPVFDES